MVRTKEELMQIVKDYIGDNTDDTTISIIEDINDTLDSLTDGEDWKGKYEANDAEWRQKYRDRFFDGGEVREAERHEEALPESDEEVEVVETFDDLFKEVTE